MFHGIFQSINDARPPACARRRKIIELATMAVRCWSTLCGFDRSEASHREGHHPHPARGAPRFALLRLRVPATVDGASGEV